MSTCRLAADGVSACLKSTATGISGVLALPQSAYILAQVGDIMDIQLQGNTVIALAKTKGGLRRALETLVERGIREGEEVVICVDNYLTHVFVRRELARLHAVLQPEQIRFIRKRRVEPASAGVRVHVYEDCTNAEIHRIYRDIHRAIDAETHILLGADI